MNIKSVVPGVCVLCLLACAAEQEAEQQGEQQAVQQAVQQATDEALLTIEDVERVAGVQGVQLVPRNPQIGAGGDLNFALADGTLIVMAVIQDASMYEEWKSEEGFFHEAVTGLGDEAFQGPDFGESRYILIFREGGKAISLSSFFNMEAGGEPYFSQEQLREFARTMISRL